MCVCVFVCVCVCVRERVLRLSACFARRDKFAPHVVAVPPPKCVCVFVRMCVCESVASQREMSHLATRDD